MKFLSKLFFTGTDFCKPSGGYQVVETPFYKMDFISFCRFKHGNFATILLYLDISKRTDWSDKEGHHSFNILLLNEPLAKRKVTIYDAMVLKIIS